MPFRCAFFIDGFNYYHAIADSPRLRHLRWTDYTALAEEFLPRNCVLEKILYFSAYADWDPVKTARHKTLVRANRRDSRFKVILGKFKKKTRLCYACQNVMNGHEEKQTDVNIAIELLAGAMNDEYDTAMVVSGDNDITPAVRKVKEMFPDKRIGVLLPPRRRANDLSNVADYSVKMFEQRIKKCRLPDTVVIGPHRYECPPEWTEK